MKKDITAQAINTALDEITELLRKSMPLQKDDEQMPQEMPEQQPEMGAEQEMPEQQPEMDAEQEMPEQGEDEINEIGHLASQLSDEDLSGLIEMLSQELQGRQELQGMPQEQAPAPEMDKAMNEIGMLRKSINELKSQIATMNKPKAPAPKVANRVASTQRVEVLEKSSKEAPKVQRLNKSQTSEFLIGQIRVKNPNVSRKNLIDLQYVHSDEDLEAFQDNLIAIGVTLPTK